MRTALTVLPRCASISRSSRRMSPCHEQLEWKRVVACAGEAVALRTVGRGSCSSRRCPARPSPPCTRLRQIFGCTGRRSPRPSSPRQVSGSGATLGAVPRAAATEVPGRAGWGCNKPTPFLCAPEVYLVVPHPPSPTSVTTQLAKPDANFVAAPRSANLWWWSGDQGRSPPDSSRYAAGVAARDVLWRPCALSTDVLLCRQRHRWRTQTGDSGRSLGRKTRQKSRQTVRRSP